MQNYEQEIRTVVKSITEPRDADELLAGVDKYFTENSTIIHPMLNSPASAGRDGVKSAYKMLRVLTIGNKIDFHAVAFDKIVTRKGVDRVTGLLDLTETLQLRFLPLPTSANPWIHIRFLIRVDLEKSEDGLWRILKQEDNLPTDFGSTGLNLIPGLKQISDGAKWAAGTGTLVTARFLSALGLFK